MTQVVDAAAEQTPISPHSVAWHSLPAKEVTNLLEVNEHVGLEAAEVQARLDRTGFNRLPEIARRPAWLRFMLPEFIE
jgi:magnesium-transporting ATPase (P-type)